MPCGKEDMLLCWNKYSPWELTSFSVGALPLQSISPGLVYLCPNSVCGVGVLVFFGALELGCFAFESMKNIRMIPVGIFGACLYCSESDANQ